MKACEECKYARFCRFKDECDVQDPVMCVDYGRYDEKEYDE